jgi:hypothetical protein
MGIGNERSALRTEPAFVCRSPWNRRRPNKLVIACSDGRLQENLDDFLQGHLGIEHYDRLYAPGGPGALATSGIEFSRSDVFRRECLFLVAAHDVEDIYFIFHGPSDDGPAEAVCADYRRIFPRHAPDQIRAEQAKDLAEILNGGFGFQRAVRVHAYRCEVTGDGAVRFIDLRGAQEPGRGTGP